MKPIKLGILSLIALGVLFYPGGVHAHEELLKNNTTEEAESDAPADFLEREESRDMADQISALERRLDQLEERKRFLGEKIQNLERKLDDLRRVRH